jgi:6,7-dimethyl-8-ribityllumazine synthase
MEYEGELRGHGPVAVLASQFNQRVTSSLLDGALECCRAAGLSEHDIDVIRVAGAFELGAAAATVAALGRYSAIIALGAVIRGETSHFEYVATAAARGLGTVAVHYGIPVGFGVLTTDTEEQAFARAGGPAGNKGYEAAEAALRLADVIARLRETHGNAAVRRPS